MVFLATEHSPFRSAVKVLQPLQDIRTIELHFSAQLLNLHTVKRSPSILDAEILTCKTEELFVLNLKAPSGTLTLIFFLPVLMAF